MGRPRPSTGRFGRSSVHASQIETRKELAGGDRHSFGLPLRALVGQKKPPRTGTSPQPSRWADISARARPLPVWRPPNGRLRILAPLSVGGAFSVALTAFAGADVPAVQLAISLLLCRVVAAATGSLVGDAQVGLSGSVGASRAFNRAGRCIRVVPWRGPIRRPTAPASAPCVNA